jgi:hypothetical protein
MSSDTGTPREPSSMLAEIEAFDSGGAVEVGAGSLASFDAVTSPSADDDVHPATSAARATKHAIAAARLRA